MVLTRLLHESLALGVSSTLIKNGLHPWSAVRLRLRQYDDIRFCGRPVGGPDPGRLAWMVRHIWAGEYDLPGFVPAPGQRVLDLGANVGVFSLLAASRGASVTAIEPHAATFSWLKRNSAGWAVECRRYAVVGRVPSTGRVEFVEGPTSTSHHVAGVRGDEPRRRSTTVPVVSFEALVRDGFDLIKVDIEGAEFEMVLNTPLEVLGGISRLVAEVHRLAGDPSVLCDRLEAAGLAVTLIAGEDPDHCLLAARTTVQSTSSSVDASSSA